MSATDRAIARALHPDRTWVEPIERIGGSAFGWMQHVPSANGQLFFPWDLEHPNTVPSTLEALARLELGVVIMPASLGHPDAPYRLAIETPECRLTHGFGPTFTHALAMATRSAFDLGMLA